MSVGEIIAELLSSQGMEVSIEKAAPGVQTESGKEVKSWMPSDESILTDGGENVKEVNDERSH